MFVQGLFIAILQAAGSIATVEDGKNLQNLLVCLEMLPAALGMLVAFPYTEYKGSGEHLISICQCSTGCLPCKLFMAVLARCMPRASPMVEPQHALLHAHFVAATVNLTFGVSCLGGVQGPTLAWGWKT